MSLHASAWAKAVTHSPEGEALTRSEKLVLMVISDYHNNESGYAWPSMPRLAREAIMSERHARTITQALEKKGLLRIERMRREDGLNFNNRYFLPPLEASAPLAPVPANVVTKAPTATEIGEALVDEVLPAFLADFPDAPLQGFIATLDAAVILAEENAGASKDIGSYLRNRVIAAAAAEYSDVDGKGMARLFREAKVLGPDGGKWVVAAILNTTSANVEGDATSYVIASARRMKAEVAA